MFTRWLTTVNDLSRFGVAFARLIDAGRRSRTTGRAAITNGRIWAWTIGADGLERLVSAALAVGSACAAGTRLVAAGPSCVANAWTCASVAVVWRNVPGSSAIAVLTLRSSDANARNTLALES